MTQIRGKRFDVKMPDGTVEQYNEKDWQHEDEGPCPRCQGDHSWCQSVQPDEFGGK